MNPYNAAVADLLDQRIADLIHDVSWYKTQPNPRHWRDLRIEADRELRALRNLRRQAQRLAESRPDPITEYKSYDDWTQSELAGAWGR